jgi:REP element-mobilizing transposase RayT
LFGEIKNAQMQFSDIGILVEQEWQKTAQVRPLVTIDDFVVMPNHLHGILIFETDVRTDPVKRHFGTGVADSLATVVGQFKSVTTKQANMQFQTGNSLWQRNYFERVIRSEDELLAARRYIMQNPQRWHEDRENIPSPP